MSTTVSQSEEAIRETVRERYGKAAREVLVIKEAGGCCGGAATPLGADPITSDLYSAAEAAEIPVEAMLASLGCGNPTALATLAPGETVLDLGSGGGIDVLLSAKRVGPTGFAYGLDMTDDMLALAEQNKQKAGAENVAFLKGELPADLRADMEAWVGCVAGALEEQEYRRLLAEAGFGDVDIEVTRVYDPVALAESVASGDCCGSPPAVTWDDTAYARFAASGGRVVSAFVRARKPSRTSDVGRRT